MIRPYTRLCIILLGLVLAGCSAAFKERLADGYQLGDFSAAQRDNLAIYCGPEIGVTKAVAKAALEASIGFAVPVNICVLWEMAKASTAEVDHEPT